MSKVINLHAAGVIKNGEKVASLDYTAGATSIWDLALCKINGTVVLFSKHSSGSTYSVSSLDQIANFTRDNQVDSAAALAIIEAVKPYAVSSTSSAGYAYTSDSTETGLYFDGVNKITTAPVTPPSANDLIKQALGGTGSTGGTGANDNTEVVPLWKKPILYIGIAVLAIIGYFAWKK